MQMTQFLALSNQLHDAQSQLDTLRLQMLDSEWWCQAAERRADRLEMMAEMESRARSHHCSCHRSPSPPPRLRKSGYRQEIFYPEGGQATAWTGTEDDDEDYFHRSPPPGV